MALALLSLTSINYNYNILMTKVFGDVLQNLFSLPLMLRKNKPEHLIATIFVEQVKF